MEVSILRVEIENFQSHHASKIDFSQGINIISGSSNNGKSAVLRAIRWVLTNDPSGTEFITLGKELCRVTVYFSNGFHITRTKSRSGNVNTYEVIKDGISMTESPLTGFGTSVPEMVRNAMEINRPDMIFSSQLEAPFLIADTPKVRAERIGNLDELGRIDRALQETNDDIRLNSKTAKQLESDIKTNQKEMDALRLSVSKRQKWIEKLNRLQIDVLAKKQVVQQLEQIATKWQTIVYDVDQCTQVLRQTNRILQAYDETLPQQVETYSFLFQRSHRLDEIETTISNLKTMDTHVFNRLTDLAKNLDENIQSVAALEKIVKSLSEYKQQVEVASNQIKMKTNQIDLIVLDQQIERYRMLMDIQKKINTCAHEINTSKDAVATSTHYITVLIDEFVKALQTEKLCPLCLQNTEHVHIDANQIL